MKTISYVSNCSLSKIDYAKCFACKKHAVNMFYLDFSDKLCLGYMKGLMNTLSSALFFM